MITSRQVTEADRKLIEAAISVDTFHQYASDYFYRPNTVNNVYFIDDVPVVFVSGSLVMQNGKRLLKLDLLFTDNNAKQHNAAVLLKGFEVMEHFASGRFDGFLTSSNNPELAAFAVPCSRPANGTPTARLWYAYGTYMVRLKHAWGPNRQRGSKGGHRVKRGVRW